ncbi:conserved hypothetical protein [Tenacibaculum sediminilitoris]|uniref:acetyltransferase n=1 Tax=Tenacibaculum sediminilitoris TaxID=1820334 RepID=UPI003893BC20
MNEIILVGGFEEIIELAEECGKRIYGIIDKANKTIENYLILGTEKDVDIFDKTIKNKPLIITPDTPKVRKKLHFFYKENGFVFSQLLSKRAMISESARIEEGTVVQRGVNISTDVCIGVFVKLNVNCNVMHNTVIGDYTTIAPNAVILGNVNIGDCCYMGANSTVLPNIKICNDVVIGAGAVVTKDINESGTYVGIPAKLINLTK